MSDYNPKAHGANCDVCPLRGCTPVPPEGPSNPLFAVIGEAPGEEEERQGKPFVGPSGAMMEEALRLASVKRRDVLITNSILCRPPGNDLDALNSRVNRENKRLKDEHKLAVEEANKQGLTPPDAPEQTPSALACCKPRLLGELRFVNQRITLGKTATNLLTGNTGGVVKIRGGVIELKDPEDASRTLKTMPTVHPAFALRQRRWVHVFKNDVAKAVRWFRGEIDWVPPKFVWCPTPEELITFLASAREFAYDLETDGIETLTAKIRCVGIATRDVAVVISLLGQDGLTRFYSIKDEMRIISILDNFFTDESITKVSFNGINYDGPVLFNNWGFRPKGEVDVMLIHRLVEPELPHNLAYVASLFSTSKNWKVNEAGEKMSTAAETDEQLAEYCAFDAAITLRIATPLVERLQLRDQVAVWESDQRIQAICAEMHAVGMYVDQKARLKEEKKLLEARWKVLQQIRNFIGRPKFNPGSVQQIRKLLFDEWGLDPLISDEKDKYTATALAAEELTWEGISTGDLILRALLFDAAVPKDKRSFIKLLRRYRKLQKVLGTYVCKLRYQDEINDLGWWDEDTDGVHPPKAWADADTMKRYGGTRTGIVNRTTGRMHPGWSAGITKTGRLSSSKPLNAMNFPLDMRKIITGAPGHCLVGADMDQLELRIAAARWQIPLYLRAFAEGKDPHSMTAYAVFGETFCKAAGVDPKQFSPEWRLPFSGAAYDESGAFDKSKASPEAKELRDLSKTIAYASQYMGNDSTVHKIVQKTEVAARGPDGKPLDDGTTDLPYARKQLKETRAMRKRWLQNAPEFEKGWEQEINSWRKKTYILEPVGGRRHDFLDGEDDASAMVNFPVQGSAAALVNAMMLDFRSVIAPNQWGPGTGMINQCHDSIVFEVPLDGVTFNEKGKPIPPPGRGPDSDDPAIPYQVAALMAKVMTRTHDSLPGVVFTASPTIGMTWKDV